jgi:hypothetical protein
MGFFLDRWLVDNWVGVPDVRALDDGSAEGGDRLLGLSDVKIYRIAVPTQSVDDVIVRIPQLMPGPGMLRCGCSAT